MKTSRFISALSFLCFAVGCMVPPPESEETDIEEVEENSQPPQPPSYPEPSGEPPEEDFYDPCPTDTYVIVVDGNEYVIEIEVFCDPMQDFYTGCPAPMK